MRKRKSLIFLLLCMAVFLSAASPAAAAEKEEPVALPIIMYHHILKSSGNWGDYIISPDTLKGDLDYLRERGYETVTIKELIDYTQGAGDLPEKPVMITFDDGQASFGAFGFELFEAYGMHAVLSIVGKYADTYTENGDDNILYAYFSWPKLEEMNNSPFVEMAVHTYDMHSVHDRKGCKIKPGESEETYARVLNADLDIMARRFAKYLHERPVAFAYPFGFSCGEAKEILKQRGYAVIFTCAEKVNMLTGDPEELLSLGRFNRPNGENREKFFSKLGIS